MKKAVHSVTLKKEDTSRAFRWVFGFVVLFGVMSLVQVQWVVASPPDTEPNGIHSNQDQEVAWVSESPVDGTAGTSYKWNTTYTNNVTVSGLGSDSDIASGDCTLYDNATFSCRDKKNGWDYTGTYAQTGYKIKFTFDSDGLQEFADMLANWAEQVAHGEGADISDVSINFTSVKISQMTISKRTGLPGNVTVTIRGKVSAILDGKFIKKNFSYSSRVAFQ